MLHCTLRNMCEPFCCTTWAEIQTRGKFFFSQRVSNPPLARQWVVFNRLPPTSVARNLSFQGRPRGANNNKSFESIRCFRRRVTTSPTTPLSVHSAPEPLITASFRDFAGSLKFGVTKENEKWLRSRSNPMTTIMLTITCLQLIALFMLVMPHSFWNEDWIWNAARSPTEWFSNASMLPEWV